MWTRTRSSSCGASTAPSPSGSARSNEQYLARDRPLGESRVLWEIGDGGFDVRALRTRLDLDSGYLSRLLRSLEADGLVASGRPPTTGGCAPRA